MLNSNEVRNVENKQRQKLKELLSSTNYVIAFAKDIYSKVDGFIISQDGTERYTIETKWYGNKNHIRLTTKYDDYMIDFSKLYALEKEAKKNNSIPLLICFFSNELVIWDISRCNWRSTKKNENVNKEGLNYGRKEKSDMAYLYFEDAIYRNKNITPFN